MSWARLAVSVACSFCSTPIAPGSPVRQGTVSSLTGYRWCASCAKRRLEEDVPADLPDTLTSLVPGTAPRSASTLRTFDPRAAGATLRTAILQRRRDEADRGAARPAARASTSTWTRDGRMAATGDQGQ